MRRHKPLIVKYFASNKHVTEFSDSEQAYAQDDDDCPLRRDKEAQSNFEKLSFFENEEDEEWQVKA